MACGQSPPSIRRGDDGRWWAFAAVICLLPYFGSMWGSLLKQLATDFDDFPLRAVIVGFLVGLVGAVALLAVVLAQEKSRRLAWAVYCTVILLLFEMATIPIGIVLTRFVIERHQ